MSKQKPDDLEAVRTVVDAIKDFDADEQQRIFRWVAEKLRLPQPFAAAVHAPRIPDTAPAGTPVSSGHVSGSSAGGAMDIKSFIEAKNPTKDVQFAAVVAYYYRFEAPPAERKDEIDQNDLQDATRKAGRPRFRRNAARENGDSEQLNRITEDRARLLREPADQLQSGLQSACLEVPPCRPCTSCSRSDRPNVWPLEVGLHLLVLAG